MMSVRTPGDIVAALISNAFNDDLAGIQQGSTESVQERLVEELNKAINALVDERLALSRESTEASNTHLD